MSPRAGGSLVARGIEKHRDRTLVLCWPPYEDDAASYAPLRAYRGEVAIYIGEGDDGATGSIRFHRELDLNWTLVEQIDLLHWPRLRDRLTVYRRNPARRAHRDRDRCDECKRFVGTGSIGRCDLCFARRPPGLVPSGTGGTAWSMRGRRSRRCRPLCERPFKRVRTGSGEIGRSVAAAGNAEERSAVVRPFLQETWREKARQAVLRWDRLPRPVSEKNWWS